MKIVLFNNLGNLGIVTDFKRLIDSDHLKFEVDEDGELKIGQRTYKVTSGRAYVPQSDILLGESFRITFKDEEGQVYDCGVIKRVGSRLIEIFNETEPCLIACCDALDRQQTEIRELEEQMRDMMTRLSITII